MAKIAYFCSIGSIDTGAPLSTLRTVELFSKEYETHLVLSEEGTFAEEARKAGIEPFILPLIRLRRFQKMRRWPVFFWSMGIACIRFYSWLKRNKIDLVHFSDIIDIPYAIPARLAGCSTLAHLRCILNRPIGKILYRWIAGGFINQVLCVSQATRHSMFPSGSEKALLLYNPGPREEFLVPPVAEPDIAEGLRILAIAKFLDVKGHANLIELAHRLEQQKISFHITLIGGQEEGHESYYQHCMELIDRYDLRDRFTLLSNLSAREVAREIDHSHLLLHLPNYQDPFPGVVLEAMARARTVVAFDSGGIKEEFEPGISGFLIPQNNLDLLTEKVSQLAQNTGIRTQTGQNAREHVLSHFNAQRYKAELSHSYQETLS